MPVIPGGDLTLLRTQPHRTDLFMIVQEPQTVMSARVNDSGIGRGERQITYDGASYEGGQWVDNTDLEPGMTVWIGSASGARDKGEVRLISATATVLTVSENWEVEWADDLYITVKKQWKLWPRQPRQVPHDDGSVDWYIDYDLVYSDENEDFRPVPILGPHRVAFKPNGNAQIAFDWTDSYAVMPGQSISTYALEAEDGTPDNPASGTPTVTYTAASGSKGFMIKVTVTDSNGKTETGYRFAFVMDRTGASAPFQNFEIRTLMGTWNEAGWRASFIVKEADVNETNFPDDALVVIFSEDWYGATKDSIGGNTVGAENIIFIGTIVKGSVEFDAYAQTVSFDAHGIASEMANCECDPFILEDDDTPDDWYEMKDVTADNVALFCARYLSNLLQIADVFVSGDDRETVFWEVPGASLREQINTHIYGDAIFAKLASDRMGRLWAEIDLQMISASDRAAVPIIMDITKPDRRDRVRIEHPMEPKASRIECSGVRYDGGGADPIAYMSGSPGESRLRRGRFISSSNLALANQAQCNNLAGWLMAKNNNPYPRIRLYMTGNYRVFDVMPQEYVTLSIASADNNRGLVWTAAKLIPRDINFRWRNNMLTVDAVFERYAIEPAGQTIEIPEAPETEWPVPPPWPPPPLPPPPPGAGGNWMKKVLLATWAGGIFYTSNFVDLVTSPVGVPVWADVSAGITDVSVGCLAMRGDPFRPAYRQFAVFSGDAVYRRVDGGNWAAVLTVAECLTAIGSPSSGSFVINGLEPNINADGWVGVLFNAYGLGGVNWATFIFISTDYGDNWTPYTIANWGIFGYTAFQLQVGGYKGDSPYTAGNVMYCMGRSGASMRLWRSVDRGLTWAQVSTLGASIWGCHLLVDPNSQNRIFIGGYSAIPCALRVSTDHGVTLVNYDDNASERMGAYNSLDRYQISVAMDLHKTVRVGVVEFFSTKFHRTETDGASWYEVVPQKSVDSLAVSIVQDAPSKVYGLRQETDAYNNHFIWASDDEFVTMHDKGGANPTLPAGGGDSIPDTCQGAVAILQIWME